MDTETKAVLELIKREAERRGYKFEYSETDAKLIRPDGTVAVQGTKHLPREAS